MEKMGKEISPEEIEEAVEKYGEKGKLDYAEFCTIFGLAYDSNKKTPYKAWI